MKESLYGELSVIGMRGCEEFTEQVDSYLKEWRRHDQEGSFLVDCSCPRFGSGEGKGALHQSLRGNDVYIIADVFNHGVTYNMYGKTVPMSPDDHFQDIKRVVGAIGGKARRISVIMPMLYEGRQHKRASRESLDCAIALQELVNMGITNIITFDAHDPRVQNAIPLSGFENVRTSYQMIKALLNHYPDIDIDPDNLMIISPDEGGMAKCMYYSSVMGIDLGTFYKRRDYSRIINGKNPIVAHEYLGRDVTGKDVIVVDDMISSGDSIIDVARQLKEKGAKRIFVFATFGLFCNGLETLDKAYEEGCFTQIFTTNLVYRTPELLEREWYSEVNMCKYVAYIIDTLNHDRTISQLLDQSKKIHTKLESYNKSKSRGQKSKKKQG
ncbi:MAG: ribose-phosphate pyrophosphokinase [Clostridia bacterium]|nr:ribose-phosphate pyrophosphokinase [Clostridia bacterium]MBQ8289785.1 ribose-phosphate pyrophosphokinase [Clostridia bacterium]